MKRKNLFQQIRGAFESAAQAVQNLFKGGRSEPETEGSIPPVEVPAPIEEPVPMPESTVAYKEEVTEPYEVHDELEGLTPEEVEELEQDDAPIFDPSEFDTSNLRRIFATLAEADAYSSEIPVPSTVFKRSTDLLYQVAVEYP